MPLGGVSKITYSKAGDILSVEDENQSITTFAYDDAHRNILRTYTDGSNVAMEYNKVSLQTKKVCEDNREINYIRNDLDHLIEVRYTDDENDIFTHDKLGRILTATKGNWVISRNYDNANRITKEVQNGKTVSYTYDIPQRKNDMHLPQWNNTSKRNRFS